MNSGDGGVPSPSKIGFCNVPHHVVPQHDLILLICRSSKFRGDRQEQKFHVPIPQWRQVCLEIEFDDCCCGPRMLEASGALELHKVKVVHYRRGVIEEDRGSVQSRKHAQYRDGKSEDGVGPERPAVHR
eukprot:CAMPEP_0175808518 /NCGR_PEP_ID=MMETSP0107_2-20121207/2301_1 /TAXON_ID=195067 ORGANISM="Goniomonas pacifica, Strain CCMP1869" /NCGR_SAMPLE_ID=MMETSP0107_2 /ASSEMBLY_ACC=CAM_ASM_000203 /LENGTH=128 /DNA_ID=CAMNT_0017120149 /DNA_START=197 /DNA_END=579 /DNA_ORIENTATION=+